MAHRTPSPGSGRLAAVLDPWAPRPVSDVPGPAADDSPTVPIPVRVQRAAGRRPGPVGRWLPASWREARIDPGRPGALAVVLVGIVAAVVAAVGVWREAPRAEPVAGLPALVTTTEAAAPASTAPASTVAAVPDELVVAVAGKVRQPGLVRVPPGSRVADAVEAAGGVLPGVDLAGVNLARKVSDGEQVAVGVPPAPDS
ncbi:MAG: SLBB domain-containing protein, partial [Pseudonocardia sp.]